MAWGKSPGGAIPTKAVKSIFDKRRRPKTKRACENKKVLVGRTAGGVIRIAPCKG